MVFNVCVCVCVCIGVYAVVCTCVLNHATTCVEVRQLLGVGSLLPPCGMWNSISQANLNTHTFTH